MSWEEQLNEDSLSWLLEENEPGVRYLTLRDLMDLPEDDHELIAAKRKAHIEEPVQTIMEYSVSGKTWVDFGEKKQPNKWVTLRAAWVLKNTTGISG